MLILEIVMAYCELFIHYGWIGVKEIPSLYLKSVWYSHSSIIQK